jgi:hypothetical protein
LSSATLSQLELQSRSQHCVWPHCIAPLPHTQSRTPSWQYFCCTIKVQAVLQLCVQHAGSFSHTHTCRSALPQPGVSWAVQQLPMPLSIMPPLPGSVLIAPALGALLPAGAIAPPLPASALGAPLLAPLPPTACPVAAALPACAASAGLPAAAAVGCASLPAAFAEAPAGALAAAEPAAACPACDLLPAASALPAVFDAVLLQAPHIKNKQYHPNLIDFISDSYRANT